MSCIPKDVFEPQDFLEDLVCPLGKGILRDPVSLSCQHVFCRKCIENYLTTNSRCPQCNEPANFSSIRPQGSFAELINMALVKCPQCGWNGNYQSYCFHEQKCSSPSIPCPQGCGLTIKKTQIVQHASMCRFRKTFCKDCKAELLYQELLIHEDVCPEKVIECPNRCGVRIKQQEKAAHLLSCKAPKATCKFAFCGCGFHDGGDSAAKDLHQNEQMLAHLTLLGSAVAKLKTRFEIIERNVELENATPVSAARENINILWSNGKKIASGEKSGWSFFLSDQPIMRNFIARIRIVHVGGDANTWKICLGLFNSKQYQAGSWEKYKNGYGYIQGNGCKVHEGGPQPYGQAYYTGDIIVIEHKDGNITFYHNDRSQGVAYSKINGPFYLAVALSDMSHQVEIVDVTELD